MGIVAGRILILYNRFDEITRDDCVFPMLAAGVSDYIYFSISCFIVSVGWTIIRIANLHEKEKNEIHKMQTKYRSTLITSEVEAILFNRATVYLEGLKRNQWNNAYYIILLYAGIFGIRNLDPFKEPVFFYIIFVIIAHVLFVFYFCNCTSLQYRMRNTRVAIQQFKTAYRRNLYWMDSNEFEKHCEKDKRVFRDPLYWLFIIVGSLAFILVVVYLFV